MNTEQHVTPPRTKIIRSDPSAAFAGHAERARLRVEHIEAGVKLFAEIRVDSKYFDQSPIGQKFGVHIGGDSNYCVQGGPGGQYRLKDVHLYARTSTGDLVQLS